jgi:type IV secretion system protein VirD4
MTTNKSNCGAMILPDGKYYSLDDFQTRLNNNVLIVGTTGAAKTRTVITPNLLECVGSYVVTDPKGNLYRQWGDYMKHHGYRVVRLSFIHPELSVHYDPLKYVKTTQQIQQLSHSLVFTDSGKSRDPYWDDTSLMLINSVISCIKEMFPEDSGNHNFHSILKLLRAAGRDGSKRTVLTKLMEDLENHNPDSWAVKQFHNVDQAPENTFNCIVSSAVAKFCSMDTEELAEMMRYDEMDLPSIGQKKTVVFVEVSDSDRSMDTLINMFFTQAMNQLCTYADEKCINSRLPVPVRFFMDDFATNCKIDNFQNMISNIRSRKISVMLILQSLSQLEESYGKSAHTIADDCDTLIYMGGNDPETARQIAIRCNKTTQTVLHMPLCSSWIFRRGEKPFMCKNFELDDYLKEKGIQREITCKSRELDKGG